MKPFLIRWLVTTLAVLVVSNIPGVGVRAEGVGPLVMAGLLLGFLNAFIRPVLLLLSLPLILLTMGLFIFCVNAFTLYIVASFIPGFHVDGFWSAIFGSILIGIFSWIFKSWFKGNDERGGGGGGGGGGVPVLPQEPAGMKTVRGRVIE